MRKMIATLLSLGALLASAVGAQPNMIETSPLPGVEIGTSDADAGTATCAVARK